MPAKKNPPALAGEFACAELFKAFTLNWLKW